MKILFIGGTGFISTAVSRQIIALGHELFIMNPASARPTRREPKAWSPTSTTPQQQKRRRWP